MDRTWSFLNRMYPGRKHFFKNVLENLLGAFRDQKLEQDNKLKCMKIELTEE